MFSKQITAAVMAVLFAWTMLSVIAQSQDVFKVRLAPVPIDATIRNDVTGGGSASSVLLANKLAITGSFEGLRSPATVARLHQGPLTGMRGPAIGDLKVSAATAGEITGSFELTSEQITSLKKGHFYIQIHSERAPDGNLWGWLLQ